MKAMEALLDLQDSHVYSVVKASQQLHFKSISRLQDRDFVVLTIYWKLVWANLMLKYSPSLAPVNEVLIPRKLKAKKCLNLSMKSVSQLLALKDKVPLVHSPLTILITDQPLNQVRIELPQLFMAQLVPPLDWTTLKL